MSGCLWVHEVGICFSVSLYVSKCVLYVALSICVSVFASAYCICKYVGVTASLRANTAHSCIKMLHSEIRKQIACHIPTPLNQK